MTDSDPHAEAAQLHARGEQLVAEGNYAEALDVFAALTVHAGVDASMLGSLHWNMAICKAWQGEWPGVWEHLRAGGQDEAEFRAKLAELGITPAPDPGSRHEAEELARRAVACMDFHDHEGALELWAELLLHPAHPPDAMDNVHWNMAVANALLGRFDKAREHVTAGHFTEEQFQAWATDQDVVLPAAPGTEAEARHLNDLAEASMRAGEYEEALGHYASLAVHPAHPADGLPNLHWNMAVAAGMAGKIENALDHVGRSGRPVEEFRTTMADNGVTIP